MNVPTTLPFYDSLIKQSTNRDGSPVALFCPRNQLIPFQIQRPHSANDWIQDIFLVDPDGNQYDLQWYFENSDELLKGGYTNGPGGLQSFDTLTQKSDSSSNGFTFDIHSAIKSTTGAGDAGFENTTDFAVTENEKLYLEINLTLNSGTAPKIVIIDGGDETTQLSNEVQLINGENNIILTITADEATATLLFYNDTAEQTNFSATVTLTRTIRPQINEFTSIDYITYNGEKLHWSGNLIREIDNNYGATTFETFTTGPGVSIASAINTSGSGVCKSYAILSTPAVAGDIYIVHIEDVVINSGQTPTFNIAESAEGAQSLTAGDHEFTFTIDSGPIANAYLQILVSAASNFSTGQISVYKVSGTHNSERPTGLGLLPKGLFYLQISDGTNTWYSEWFEIRDIYENLLVSYAAGESYDIFIKEGTKIVNAVNLAGSAAVYSALINTLANDEEITVIFFLSLNSGQLPYLVLSSGGSSVSNTIQAAEGINAITLTAIKSVDTFSFRFHNTAASDFVTSEVWVKRKYSSSFVKLSFGNSFDLHGKRSDDQSILYQNSFIQQCWLNTILATPEQKRVDVGTEKDGIFIPEKITTQYQYKIVDYINRSLFESLIKLPQHDNITIIDEVGNQYSPNAGNVIITYEWTTFDICSFTILFNDGSFVWVENADAIT